MVELRCDKCPFNPTDKFCDLLKHSLENEEAKLWHGGAIGKYGPKGDIVYPSHCGVEKHGKQLCFRKDKKYKK